MGTWRAAGVSWTGLAGALLVVALAVGVAGCREEEQTPPSLAPAASVTTAARDLGIGVWAQLEAPEGCVDAFMMPPSYTAETAGTALLDVCLPDAFVGLIVDGPDRVSESEWWALAGQGWVPAARLVPHHEGGLPYPSHPDLRDAGRIAFVGPDEDIWVMNADGSEKVRLYDLPPLALGAGRPMPEWAPTGDKIAIKRWYEGMLDIVSDKGDPILEMPIREFLSWSPSGEAFAAFFVPSASSSVLLGVFDLQGRVLLELSDAVLPSFSVDGRRLAFVVPSKGGVGTQAQARGMVADIETGEIKPLDPGSGYFTSPPRWSPTSNVLAYGTRLINFDSGEERALPGSVSAWSPDGRFILLDLNRIYDVSQGEVTHTFSLSYLGTDAPPSDIVRGRFGWSGDSRYFLYIDGEAFRDRPRPANLYVYDSISQSTTRLALAPSSDFEVFPDGSHVVYSKANRLLPPAGEVPGTRSWIMLLDTNQGTVTLLAEGFYPSWHPGK